MRSGQLDYLLLQVGLAQSGELFRFITPPEKVWGLLNDIKARGNVKKTERTDTGYDLEMTNGTTIRLDEAGVMLICDERVRCCAVYFMPKVDCFNHLSDEQLVTIIYGEPGDPVYDKKVAVLRKMVSQYNKILL